MKRSHKWFRYQGKLLLGAAALAGMATPIVLGLVSTAPGRAQSPIQTATATPPTFEYEVASIKPNKSGAGNISNRTSDDGLTITNFPLSRLIQLAFGVPDYQISGSPNWLNSENYDDIDAKMDGSVADALKKLSPDDRRLTRQRMLQAHISP